MKQKNVKKYYKWLVEYIDVDGISDNYGILLKALYNTPFRWFVPNDDNRAFEGLNLRDQFTDEFGIEYDFNYFPRECSMFELLVGLSLRCDDMCVDSRPYLNYKEWFWKLLDNADLTCYDDYHYEETAEIYGILESIIQRTYKRNGAGGFFPLRGRCKDQRKVELWYQMSTYITNNYFVD